MRGGSSRNGHSQATGGRTVARNVAGLLVARGTVAVAGLISLPVLYRQLTASELGAWILLTGLTTIVGIADLGLGSATVRAVAADLAGTRRDTRIVLALGLIWPVAVALLATLLLLLLWSPLAGALNFGDATASGRTAALLLMAGLLVDGIALPWRGVLEGSQRYPALVSMNAGTAVLGAGLTIAVAVTGGGLVELAACSVVASLLRTALIIAVTARLAPALSPSLAGATAAEVRTATRYGLRVQLTAATGAVNLELDRYLLAGFFGTAVAAGFELGGRLVGLFRLVPAFALMALFPMAVTQTAQRGRDWLRTFNLQATRYLTMVAATGAAMLVVCADPLVRLWLGEPNAWAAANIAILAPAFAFNIAAGPTSIATRVEGRPGRETSYALLSAGLNLALTWPLLWWLGPQGVPLATAAGVIAGTCQFLVHYHRSTGQPLRPMTVVLARPLAAAAAASVIGWWLARYLPDEPGRAGAALAAAGRGSVVLLVAVVLLIGVGSITAEDRQRLAQFLHLSGGPLPEPRYRPGLTTVAPAPVAPMPGGES
jgi:O-antigen/teichoic acid export membrane protein